MRLSAQLFILLAAQQYAPLVIAAGGDAIAVACARLCGGAERIHRGGAAPHLASLTLPVRLCSLPPAAAGLAGALGTLYVHIDAALRGRLSASTFRLLNWASLLNAVTLSAVRQRILKLRSAVALPPLARDRACAFCLPTRRSVGYA